MADNKNKGKLRIILLVVVGLMTVYTLTVWFFNYRTLQRAVVVNDVVAEDQSKNMRYYAQEYRTTKVELNTANEKIVDLTTELEAANTELSTTRTELSSLQDMNDDLKGTIDSLERYKAKAQAKGEALGVLITAFKKKNYQLDSDLQAVRKELSTFQPDITDTDEGRAKITRFKEHIKMVKLNMHALKEQAIAMKVAAQKEKDRLEMLYGNNGFMVKNGVDQSLKRRGAKVDIQVEFQ